MAVFVRWYYFNSSVDTQTTTRREILTIDDSCDSLSRACYHGLHYTSIALVGNIKTTKQTQNDAVRATALTETTIAASKGSIYKTQTRCLLKLGTQWTYDQSETSFRNSTRSSIQWRHPNLKRSTFFDFLAVNPAREVASLPSSPN